MNDCYETETCRMDSMCPNYTECCVAEQDSGPVPPVTCGSCDAGLPMSCTCPVTITLTFPAADAETLAGMAHPDWTGVDQVSKVTWSVAQIVENRLRPAEPQKP